MDYFLIIQDAVDYIEKHLYEDITIENVATEISFSIPHFYRIFSSLVGETPKSYIRKRRISNSAVMLKESDLKICDVAFESAFDSHEVFSRAFRKMYGVSPKYIRSLENFSLYERFDSIAKKTILESEVITLDTKIIYKDPFKIIGKTVKLNQSEQLENNLIHNFIETFQKEVKLIPDLQSIERLISMYEYDPHSISEDDEHIDYFYTLGVEFKEDSVIPEGYVVKEIPHSKYAQFIHNHKENTLNGVSFSSLSYEGKPVENIYDYIDGVWILNSGYTLSDNPDFEVRDTNNGDVTEYYISIQSS